MIYTRFGSEVRIIDADIQRSRCTIEYLDGNTPNRRVVVADLIADNGIGEIVKSMQAVQKK